MKQTLMAGAATSRFAHLLGIARPAPAAKAEDDDKEPKDAAAEDDDKEDDEDEDKKSGKAKSTKSKRADDSDDDEASAEDDDEDEDDEKKSKKAKSAKTKEDDEDEEGGDDYDEGRKAERSRWAAVLTSPAAGHGRLAAACEMLSGTTMCAKAIVRTLGALPAGAEAPAGLRGRMAAAPAPKVGSSGGAAQTGEDSFAAEMAAAVGKVRG